LSKEKLAAPVQTVQLPRSFKPMNKAVVALSRTDALRKAFRGLKLHRLYNGWLDRFPRTKRMPGSGIVYRARRTESVSLALEILEGGNDYDATLFPPNFTTFADIGCNVGYFPVLLAHHAQGRQIKGLMVDANPAVVAEACWHVQANKWNDVHVLEGLVGLESDSGTREFYVHEANTCSNAELGEAQRADKDKFEKITVPVIQFGAEWRRRFGETRCNILKIDIEGCELMFLKADLQFLKLVDVIYVEWHKYRVSLDELKGFLESQGFRLQKILQDEGLNGLAFFVR
jgi:FkbM family methyltransferase